jgi:L-threonylcarbamoyladenylate synthase
MKSGGVIAYPTDTVFGLGCLPTDATAIQRILDIKERSASKGLILLAANPAQLEIYTDPTLADADWRTITTARLEPTTWLVPARKDVSSLLRGEHSTIAVRITRHPASCALCLAANSAIVSTSANLSGQLPASSRETLSTKITNSVDLVLNDTCGTPNQPSQIRHLKSGNLLRS